MVAARVQIDGIAAADQTARLPWSAELKRGIASLRSLLHGCEDAALRGSIGAVALLVAVLTWGHWGDIQVDCGKELYVPYEILRGKLLYRDIFYPYGPLPPYLGALLIEIFGQHLVVFYLFGIAIAIGCALLLFELGAMLESRAAGLTAAVALLLVGFGPAIFNFPFPYSYGATMGLLLGLLCAWFTLRHVLDWSGYNMLMAGLAAGMALLCKLEFGVACYLMLAFVIVMEAILQRSLRPLLRGFAASIPGIVLWVGVYGWFFWKVTPDVMVNGNWLGPGSYFSHTGGPTLYSMFGERFILGELINRILLAAVTLMLWFFLAKANLKASKIAAAILVTLVLFHRFVHLGSVLPPHPHLLEFMTKNLAMLLVFPVGMFFIGCGFLAYSTYGMILKDDRRRFAEVAFALFALLPALRVLAEVEPFNFNVYYSMPLFLIFVIAISRCIKAATPTLSPDRQRRLVGYMLAAEVLMLAVICLCSGTAPDNGKLETSWGAFYMAPDEAITAQQILAFMSAQERQGRQVVLLPEAPVFYVFAGTDAPSRWHTILPGFLSPAQEDSFIADLNRAAPEYILLTARDTPEYGARSFGIDYYQKTFHWIEANYRVAGEFGHFHRDVIRPSLAALLYEKVGSGPPDSTALR